jgi:O-antigen/teichoic acid export membrane protein
MRNKGIMDKLTSLTKGNRSLQSFAGKSVPLFIIAICNTIVNFLLFTFAFKFLGADKFGEYRLFFSVIAFSGFFHLGFIDGLFQYWMVNNEDTRLIHVGQVILISSFSLIVLIFFPISFRDPWIILPTIIFLNLNALFNNIIVKSGIYYSGMLSMFLIHLSALIFIYISRESLTVHQFTIVYFLLTIIASFVLFLYCFKKGYFKKESGTIMRVAWDIKYFTSGIPILLSGLFFISFFNLDKILLAKTSDSTSFGHFAMASSIISVLFAILGAPVNLVFSKLLQVKSSLFTAYYNKIFFAIYFSAILLPIISIQISPLLFDILQLDAKLLPFLNTWLLLLFPLSFLQLILFNLFKKNNLHIHFSIMALVMVFFMFALFSILKDYKNILMLTPVIYSIIIAIATLYSENILINKNVGNVSKKMARWLTLGAYSLFVVLFFTFNENFKG